ncbi:hypothetical protein AK812_SmicGene29745 [Symbiodinium microadriaticum]|uniref:Uncharacterized protein n=1 Tax=Symbiodinium microadriaticum TaxID=2951 RepID=A0A1Q9D121_SYMMI|nr:hypothetical protein AK812_SmicGene29745 [Symbiodinium microadriaticum]
MADDLIDDIERLSTFLAQQKGQVPEEAWEAMTKKHSQHLIGRIRALRVLTTAQATAMGTAVAASSSLFVGKEAKEALSVELSNKLAECLDPDSSSRKKRQLQEIGSFRHYFSAKDLEILEDETKSDQDKYDRVSARMFAVGLAFPNEASFAIIFHAAIAAGIKVESPTEGLRKLNQFKKVHRKKREATKGPFKDYVQRFPDDPEALPEELRDSYQGDPRQSLSEMDVREASDKLTGMRKSKKECSSQGSSQGLLSLQPAAAADLQAGPANMAQALPMMAQMMHGMMQIMQHMNPAAAAAEQAEAPALQIYKPKPKARAARALADVPAIAEEKEAEAAIAEDKKGAEAEKTEPDKGNQNMLTTPEKNIGSTGEPDPKKPKLTMDFSPEQMALMVAGSNKPTTQQEPEEEQEEEEDDDDSAVMKKPGMKRRRPDGHIDRYYYKGDQRFRTRSEAENAGFRG